MSIEMKMSVVVFILNLLGIHLKFIYCHTSWHGDWLPVLTSYSSACWRLIRGGDHLDFRVRIFAG
jgi:hypothetical protein